MSGIDSFISYTQRAAATFSQIL